LDIVFSDYASPNKAIVFAGLTTLWKM